MKLNIKDVSSVNMTRIKECTKEEWMPIKEWEGRYEISSFGRVRSLQRIAPNGRTVTERFLIQTPTRGDYLTVLLKDISTHRKKRYRVSRLVAEAFIPNPLHLAQVNHKDENRHNNNVSNLEWCTAAYNLGYNGGFERRGKKHRKVVCQIDMNGLLIRKFSSATEAAKEVKGFVTNISAVCLGRMKSYRGYGWGYE